MKKPLVNLSTVAVAAAAWLLAAAPAFAQPNIPPHTQPPRTNSQQRDDTKQLQSEPIRFAIPPDFFALDPFTGAVRCGGLSLPMADTIIRRTAPDPVTPPFPIEIISLELVGVQPVRVTPRPSDKETADKVLEELK